MANIIVESKTYEDIVHALNKAWHDRNECQITIDCENSLVSLLSGYHEINSIDMHDSGDMYISMGGTEALIHHCDKVTYEKLVVDDGAYFDGYTLIYKDGVAVLISIAHGI